MRAYFASARPVALLADRRAAEAARALDALAKASSLPRAETTNIVLLKAHALAEIGERRDAEKLVTSAEVVDFAAFRQKRLAGALSERYGLAGRPQASGERASELSATIQSLEIELVRPKLRSFGAALARAA